MNAHYTWVSGHEFLVPDAEKGRGLRSPHEAPANGYQCRVRIRENAHHSGQPGISDYDENRNYFFRVRAVLNANGNVKSALYGKVYGDFMEFSFYLNPTPNDGNVKLTPSRIYWVGWNPFRA